ncbi:MAG: DUF1559 domain-containing protein, partial [Planctomycetales bacterium]|nr:DUF1559 domain-containing protein [Planctomycetales bacterium]
TNNLKQIGIALTTYESAHREYPPGRLGCDNWTGDDCTGFSASDPRRNDVSGFVLLLPHLENQPLYDVMQPGEADGIYARSNAAWKTPQKLEALATRPPVFVCPSSTSKSHLEINDNLGVNINWEPKPATGTYAFVAGINGPTYTDSWKRVKHNTGVFHYVASTKIRAITDGLSHTAFAGEVVNAHDINTRNIWSLAMRQLDCLRTTEWPLNGPIPPVPVPGGWRNNGRVYTAGFGSEHPGGALFVRGDASVDFVSESVDTAAYNAMATIRCEDGVGPGTHNCNEDY